MQIDRSAIARGEERCILITISTEREQCRCHHQISHRCVYLNINRQMIGQ